jgi:cytochrome P450
MIQEVETELALHPESLLLGSTSSSDGKHGNHGQWRKSPAARSFHEQLLHIVQDRLVQQQQEDDKRRYASPSNPDILAFLLHKDEGHMHHWYSHSDRLSANEITDHVRSLLVKGIESTSSLVEWMVWELARHPHMQDRLRDEVDQHWAHQSTSSAAWFPSSASAGTATTAASTALHGPVHHTDWLNLPYLDAVLQEGLRLYAPFMVLRQLTDDVTLTHTPSGQAVTLPAHVTVAILPCLIQHRNPLVPASPTSSEKDMNSAEKEATATKNSTENVFYPDSEFHPDRHLSHVGGHHNHVGHHSYTGAFSMGPRDCVGHALAMTLLRSVLVHLIRHYTWKTTTDNYPHPVWTATAIRPHCNMVLDFAPRDIME